jgi:hypothetical protein
MYEFIVFTIGGLAAAGIYVITASDLTLTYPADLVLVSKRWRSWRPKRRDLRVGLPLRRRP